VHENPILSVCWVDIDISGSFGDISDWFWFRNTTSSGSQLFPPSSCRAFRSITLDLHQLEVQL
jgi:hypothetical protein